MLEQAFDITKSYTASLRLLVYDKNKQFKEAIDTLLDATVEIASFELPHRTLRLKFKRKSGRRGLCDSDIYQLIYIAEEEQIPVFFGSQAQLKDESNGVISLTAFSYEQLLNQELLSVRTIGKGKTFSAAIVDIFEHALDVFELAPLAADVEHTNNTLAKSFAYGDSVLSKNIPATPWQAIDKLAVSAGMRAFINTEGRLVIRPYTQHPVYTFSIDEGNLLGEVAVEDTRFQVKNHVRIFGKEQKGFIPSATAIAAGELAPEAIGRRIYKQQDTNLASAAACLVVAEQKLKELTSVDKSWRFDAVLNPFLEEYDWVALEWEDYHVVIPLAGYDLNFTAASSTFFSNVKVKEKFKIVKKLKRLKVKKKAS